MASRPDMPQPASFYSRVRLAADIIRGRVAQPIGQDPVVDASPSEPNAPVPQGAITRAYGGGSFDPRWLNALAINDDSTLRAEGVHDLELYDRLLDDSEAAAAFQQRRLAIVARPWEVEAGDDSPLAQAAADHLREQLKVLPWDRICDRMLYGLWYGYAVGEAFYRVGPDGKYWLSNINVADRKWFAFTNAGELRLRTVEAPEGEIVPPNKFWAYRTGGSHDFVPYGTGLAHWCYWPIWYKRNGISFWSVYLEKFGMPTALAKFQQGSTEETIANLLAAASAVGRDKAVAIPDIHQLDLLAQGRSSDDSYLEFVGIMDDYLRRTILGQTGTSKSEAQGLGGSQSDVMKDVRDELVRSDSDLLHESFNGTIARWLTGWNFGPDVATPRLYRNLEDQEDLNAIVERDTKLKALGWVRTEESAREIYGEGYERQETPEPVAVPPAVPGSNVVDIATARARREEFAAMAGPEPLYIHRKLKPSSARALLAWAREQGIPNLEPASELHVTVLYSKAAVDWFEMAEDDWGAGEVTVQAGGPRAVEKFGDKGAIVLRFASKRLQYRHEELIARGASHDFDDYSPHVTIAYAPDFDPAAVEPFQGEIALGPEVFAPIDDSWQSRVTVSAFSVTDLDRIDRWADELARETDPAIAAFVADLKPKVRGITDPDALRVVLLEALEKFPAERIGELAGLPFTAGRSLAQAGLE